MLRVSGYVNGAKMLTCLLVPPLATVEVRISTEGIVSIRCVPIVVPGRIQFLAMQLFSTSLFFWSRQSASGVSGQHGGRQASGSGGCGDVGYGDGCDVVDDDAWNMYDCC